MANIIFKLAFWNMELLVFLKYQKQLCLTTFKRYMYKKGARTHFCLKKAWSSITYKEAKRRASSLKSF